MKREFQYGLEADLRAAKKTLPKRKGDKTKQQHEAIIELTDQLATVAGWLEDTGYPRKDTLALLESWSQFKRAFPEHFTSDTVEVSYCGDPDAYTQNLESEQERFAETDGTTL